VQVAQTVIADGRTGLEAFPSEKHFANWLGLLSHQRDQRRQGAEAPHAQSPPTVPKWLFARRANVAVQKPKLSGSTVPPPAHPIGSAQGHHRMARKLACLFYRLLTKASNTWTEALQYYEARTATADSVRFQKSSQLGLQLSARRTIAWSITQCFWRVRAPPSLRLC